MALCVYIVPAIIIVGKVNNCLRETVITTVITRQHTAQMVVTNRKLPIRRCCDPTIIMAGTRCNSELLHSTLLKASVLQVTWNIVINSHL